MKRAWDHIEDYKSEKLKAKSKVEIVRRGLKLLKEQTDRESLRNAFQEASQITRKNVEEELKELDHLSKEGLDDE